MIAPSQQGGGNPSMAKKRGKSGDAGKFNEEEAYDQFPPGPGGGYARGIKLNDPELFTDQAKEDPTIQEFLAAPFEVSYFQFKSSTRESEWALHKPHLAYTGRVKGIDVNIEKLSRDNPRIGTYIINHENTMAIHIWRTLSISDGKHTGQMVHKEEGS
jgi:hypothetical protein